MIASRKAMVEVQFNWIFVLIVGAIILAFFVTLITNQKKVSEEKLDLSSLITFDSLLVGAGVSANTLVLIDTPKLAFMYDCDSFQIGSVSRATRERPIFSPRTLQGRKLISWTRDWFYPFKITNFLYVSNPEKEYVFVKTGASLSPLLSSLHGELPANFSSSISSGLSGTGLVSAALSVASASEETQYRIIFPSVNTNKIQLSGSLAAKEDALVTALSVGDQDMRFYVKEGSVLVQKGTPQPHFKDVSILFAALFTDDLENYKCAMGKAVRAYYVVGSGYLERAKSMNTDLPAYCTFVNDKIITALETTLQKIPLKKTAYDAFVTHKQTMESTKATLESLNKIMKSDSCPIIY